MLRKSQKAGLELHRCSESQQFSTHSSPPGANFYLQEAEHSSILTGFVSARVRTFLLMCVLERGMRILVTIFWLSFS